MDQKIKRKSRGETMQYFIDSFEIQDIIAKYDRHRIISIIRSQDINGPIGRIILIGTAAIDVSAVGLNIEMSLQVILCAKMTYANHFTTTYV